jgi:hypothetical protein
MKVTILGLGAPTFTELLQQSGDSWALVSGTQRVYQTGYNQTHSILTKCQGAAAGKLLSKTSRALDVCNGQVFPSFSSSRPEILIATSPTRCLSGGDLIG